jgi:dihydroxy-acid dehydratase
MAENLASVPDLKVGQEVILPLEKPIKETGHIQILYGNMAPEGSVAKITGESLGTIGWRFTRGELELSLCTNIAGKEGLYFRGTARVFDQEEAMLEALAKDPPSFKGTVIVIR